MGNQRNTHFNLIRSILVITGFMVLNLLPVSTFAQNDLIHEKTFQVNTGEKFILETDVGDALINSWDKNEVIVKVLGNDNAKEKLEFKFEKTSDGVFVKCKKIGKSSWSWGSGIKLKYEIRIPQKFDLEVSTAGGDIKVTDVDGNG